MKEPVTETQTFEVYDDRGNLVETIIQTRIQEVKHHTESVADQIEAPEGYHYVEDRTLTGDFTLHLVKDM